MTVVNSNVFRLNVTAPSANLLSQIADGMAPNSWAQAPSDNIILLKDATTEINVFVNQWPYNAFDEVIEGLGQGHGGNGMRTVRYYANSGHPNAGSFQSIGTDPWFPGDINGHAYDSTIVNPYTGDLYGRQYTSAINWRRRLQTNPNVAFTQLPTSGAIGGSELGCCWWSGPFTPTGGGGIAAGAQGCIMTFVDENNTPVATQGRIMAFDPLTNTYFYNQTSRAPFANPVGVNRGYHMVMAYNPTSNVALYGGGNSAPRGMWKMDQFGTVTTISNPNDGTGLHPQWPAPIGGYGCGGVGHSRFCADPSTTGFLMWDQASNTIWHFNPAGSGTITQKQSPPVSLSIGDNASVLVELPGIGPSGGVIGVIGFYSTAGYFWLYRNA